MIKLTLCNMMGEVEPNEEKQNSVLFMCVCVCVCTNAGYFIKSDGAGELWAETWGKVLQCWVKPAVPMRLVLQEARRGQQRAGEQDRCPHTCGTFCTRNLLDSHHCGRFGRATEESWGITGGRGMVMSQAVYT